MRGHEHKHGRPPPSGDSGGGRGRAGAGAAAGTAVRPCAECLDPALAVAKPAWRLSRPVAFWLIAYAFAVTMLGTTLPTPLYVIYQAQWHFSTSLITLIFATYAVGVLAALLAAGRSSDQAGRRPVLAAAIGLSIASAATFILAPSVGWLFAGRALSGLSAGLMTGTATAALTETARPGSGRRASLVSTTANIGGLGLGPLLAGLMAQYAPQPTVLPFAVQLGLVTVAGIGLLAVPETVSAPGCPSRFTARASRKQAGPSSSPPDSPLWPRSPCSGCSARSSPPSSSACCTTAATRPPERSYSSPSPPASAPRWPGPGCRAGR